MTYWLIVRSGRCRYYVRQNLLYRFGEISIFWIKWILLILVCYSKQRWRNFDRIGSCLYPCFEKGKSNFLGYYKTELISQYWSLAQRSITTCYIFYSNVPWLCDICETCQKKQIRFLFLSVFCDFEINGISWNKHLDNT